MVEFLDNSTKWYLLDHEGFCKEVKRWESTLDNTYEHNIIKQVMQGMMDTLYDYLEYVED